MHHSRLASILMVAAASAIGGCGSASPGPRMGAATHDDSNTWIIEPHTTRCFGVGPMICMVVAQGPGEDPVIFHGSIAGLQAQWGYRLTALVEREAIESPGEDQARHKYRLREIVSREPADPSATFAVRVLPEDLDLGKETTASADLSVTIFGTQTAECATEAICGALAAIVENEAARDGLLTLHIRFSRGASAPPMIEHIVTARSASGDEQS